jgi:hypothetical protein
VSSHVPPKRPDTLQSPRQSVLGELWEFVRDNKKFWMIPILAVFVIFGLLMLIGGTAAAPFIYTLF